jgi:nitrate/TMAO reductase-like tetraheme cytochrome c subunit
MAKKRTPDESNNKNRWYVTGTERFCNENKQNSNYRGHEWSHSVLLQSQSIISIICQHRIFIHKACKQDKRKLMKTNLAPF